MAITYQQLIDQAVEQASKGMSDSDIEDLEMKAESLAPIALRQVADRVAANPETRASLLRSLTIALTNGSGTIPDTALLDYLGAASLLYPTDLTQTYTYVRNWEDFIRDPETRLGRFNVKETTITVIQPTATYAAGSGLTANVELTIPTAPAIPTNATDPITDLPANSEDDLINTLVGLLRGA